MLSRSLALVADGDAARKALLFDLLKAGIVVRESAVKVFDGVAEFFRDGLSAVHANTMPYVRLGVQG